jgi:biopolymer transport protein ExbD
MGMNVGSSSGGDAEPLVEMNTTPLIDVMLVLLIMFIITIPIQLHSVNMNMPTGNPPPPLVLPEVVKIDINEQSVVFWNGVALTNQAELEQKLQEVSKMTNQPEIHVRPNKTAKYDIFAYVMTAAQRLGLTKIGIVGHEQFL